MGWCWRCRLVQTLHHCCWLRDSSVTACSSRVPLVSLLPDDCFLSCLPSPASAVSASERNYHCSTSIKSYHCQMNQAKHFRVPSALILSITPLVLLVRRYYYYSILQRKKEKVSSNKYEVDSLIQKLHSERRAWNRTQALYDSKPTRHFCEPTKLPMWERESEKTESQPWSWVCYWLTPEWLA